jgi:hypothetical protein
MMALAVGRCVLLAFLIRTGLACAWMMDVLSVILLLRYYSPFLGIDVGNGLPFGFWDI